MPLELTNGVSSVNSVRVILTCFGHRYPICGNCVHQVKVSLAYRNRTNLPRGLEETFSMEQGPLSRITLNTTTPPPLGGRVRGLLYRIVLKDSLIVSSHLALSANT